MKRTLTMTNCIKFIILDYIIRGKPEKNAQLFSPDQYFDQLLFLRG